MEGENQFPSNDAQAVIDAFKKKDTHVSKAALALIRSVVSRAKALRKPQLVICDPDKPFYIDSKPYDILLISLPIRIKKIEGESIPVGEDFEGFVFDLVQKDFDHFRICVRDANSKTTISGLREWSNHIVTQCEEMIPDPEPNVNGVKFVLINELGFPNFWVGGLNHLRDPKLRNELRSASHKLHSSLQAIATRKNVIIIGGSTHDAMTFQNWSPIYFPDKRQFRDHKKLTSAYKIGEIIKTAVGSDYPIYRMGGISFSVFICFDAFDLNLFFEQFANTAASKRIVPDIVFVPSYYINEGEAEGRLHAMREACKQLSLAINVTVVFCNQFFDMHRHGVFVGGQEIQMLTSTYCSRVTIDGEKLVDMRQAALPVWEEMDKLFRNPSSVIEK